MGNKTEAQWILERLSETIEREMKKMKLSDPEERKQPPPISMSDLQRSLRVQGQPQKNLPKSTAMQKSCAGAETAKGKI